MMPTGLSGSRAVIPEAAVGTIALMLFRKLLPRFALIRFTPVLIAASSAAHAQLGGDRRI